VRFVAAAVGSIGRRASWLATLLALVAPASAGCFDYDHLSARYRPDAAADAMGVDAAPTDGAVASGCVWSRYALCEDFESGSLVTHSWQPNTTQGGVVAIDGSRPHGGSYSLHVTTPAYSGAQADVTATIAESATFGPLTAGFYTRLYLWVGAAPQNANDVLIEADNSASNTGYDLETSQAGGDLQFYEFGPDVDAMSSMQMPTGRWLCIEWHVDATGSHTWIDESELTAVAYTLPLAPTLSQLFFGTYLPLVTNVVASELWIDDLVVDANRIHCTP
jgi:hypothetical protein